MSTPVLWATGRGLCFAHKDKDGVTYFLSQKGVTCCDWWVNGQWGATRITPFRHFRPFSKFFFKVRALSGSFEIRWNRNRRKCFNGHVLFLVNFEKKVNQPQSFVEFKFKKKNKNEIGRRKWPPSGEYFGEYVTLS